mmetsp:Transcript_44120/g.81550  ORF Transcript_44120/g.81550 Transcript_44120/m.81550 type:complete len:879 (-) Transcript_44120:162-2798(-)
MAAAEDGASKHNILVQNACSTLVENKETAISDLNRAFAQHSSWLQQKFLETRKRLRVDEAAFAAENESPKSRSRKDSKGILSPRDPNALAVGVSSDKKPAKAAPSAVASNRLPLSQDENQVSPSEDLAQPLIDAARTAVDKLSFREMQKDLKARGLPAAGKTDVVRERLYSAIVEEILLSQPAPVSTNAAAASATAAAETAVDPRILSPMHAVPGGSAVSTPISEDPTAKKKGNVFGKFLSGGKKMLKTKLTPAKSATKQAKSKSAVKSATRARGSLGPSSSDSTLSSSSSSSLGHREIVPDSESGVEVKACSTAEKAQLGDDASDKQLKPTPPQKSPADAVPGAETTDASMLHAEGASGVEAYGRNEVKNQTVDVEAVTTEEVKASDLTKSPAAPPALDASAQASVFEVASSETPSNSLNDSASAPTPPVEILAPPASTGLLSSSAAVAKLTTSANIVNEVKTTVESTPTKLPQEPSGVSGAAMETSVFMSPGSDTDTASPPPKSSPPSFSSSSTSAQLAKVPEASNIKSVALSSSVTAAGPSVPAVPTAAPAKPSNLKSGIYSFSQLDSSASSSSASASSSSTTGSGKAAASKVAVVSKVHGVSKSVVPKGALATKGASHALKLEQIRAQQKADRETKEKDRQDKAVEREKRALEALKEKEKDKVAKQQALKEQAKKTLNDYHGAANDGAVKSSSAVKAIVSHMEVKAPAAKTVPPASSAASVPEKAPLSFASSSSSSSSSSSGLLAGLEKTAEEEAARRAEQAAAQAAADEYDSYCMSEPEEQEADYSDEDEQNKPAKRVPEWAMKENLKEALHHQGELKIDPDGIFFECNTCSLEDIFQRSSTRYHKRTSSANWNDDKLSIYDKLVYKRSVGHA